MLPVSAIKNWNEVKASLKRHFGDPGIEFDFANIEHRKLLGKGIVDQLGQLSDWKELLSFRPPTAIQQSVQSRGQSWTVHRIEDRELGHGPVNLDYYPVNVTRLPKVNGTRLTPEALLEHIRIKITDFVDPSLSKFRPYRDEDHVSWSSQNAEGALVIIRIPITIPVPILPVPIPPVTIPFTPVVELAVVVTSKHTSSEWRFSAVRGGSGWTAVNLFRDDRPGAHPVSGNRAFGFKKSETGWTYYTRGADRLTRIGEVPIARDFGFYQTDKLWKSFQQEVFAFVDKNEGEAEIGVPVSERHSWDMVKNQPDFYDTSNQPPWSPVP